MDRRVDRRRWRGRGWGSIWLALGLLLAGLLANAPALARPAAGPVSGVLTLQGRTLHNGAFIYVDNAPNPVATTTISGQYAFTVGQGQHLITARRPGFLSSQINVAVPADSLQLPDVTLRTGDTDGDNRVGLTDLLAVGLGYGTEPPVPLNGDINEDGRINLLDLLYVGTNYGLEGPQPWTADLGPTGTPTPTATRTSTPSTSGTPTMTPTATLIPTRTATPFVPTDLCVFLFRDANSNGRWDLGEMALPGYQFRIYSATTPILPDFALAAYTFSGTETLPKCFPNTGLEHGTFRIQVPAAPLGGWGLIFSDPLGPVQAVPNIANTWEVDVEDGKAVFFSYANRTPQPTPTITTLTLCGVVTTYVPPQGTEPGIVTIQGQGTYSVAPSAVIGNVSALRAGANGCLTANINGAGFIVSGAWALATPTPSATSAPTG
ncbi:MAG: hypothetical protein KIT87_23745 [Anaerolineae bacterium]|nr:hypothetical protein [Anaerolineae bacterium]